MNKVETNEDVLMSLKGFWNESVTEGNICQKKSVRDSKGRGNFSSHLLLHATYTAALEKSQPLSILNGDHSRSFALVSGS